MNCEGFLVVGMPPRQSWPVLDDVLRRPEHPALVDLAGNVVVGAEDIELAASHRRQQEIDDLLRGPGGCGFSGGRGGRDPGKGEAGDQEMRGDLAISSVAQFVRE